MKPHSWRIVFLVILLTLVGLITLAGASPESADDFEVVATSLDNPRGLAFGPDGALYVAEAGEGGDGACIPTPEGISCFGTSGAVTRLLGGLQERVVDDLVSLGVEGGGNLAMGPHDVAFDGEGNLKVIVGLASDPAVRDPSGPFGNQGINFAQFVSVAADGSWTNEVDLGTYEAANNPDGGLPDTNPFGLLKVEDGYIVADAGANALLHIDNTGDISTLAVFPDTMVEFPPGSGDMVPMQAVPTSVVVGPDGAYYVGQLTGFPFPVGGASVLRVPAEGGEPEVYASGFTSITDIAFDGYGNLFVVEMFTNGLLSNDPTGAVIQVMPDDSRKVLASEGLVNPSGIAVGPDGMLYVTNFGTAANGGEVIRIKSYSITGTVIDAVTGNPLPGVTISTIGRTTTTGTNGSYTLTGLPAGSYTMSASRNGYTFSPSARTVTVPPNQNNQNFSGHLFNPAKGSILFPVVLWNHFYDGPWEAEPNNRLSLSNGPIRLNQDYWGYLDDQEDHFSFMLNNTGQVMIELDPPSTPDPTLLLELWHITDAGIQKRLASNRTDFRIQFEALALKTYHIRIYIGNNFNRATPYRLYVSPSP